MDGLSVFEILLVVTLLAIVLTIYFPLVESIKGNSDLMVAVNVVNSSLRRAQTKAINGENDDAWGAKIESGKVTIFQGPTFFGRNIKTDEFVFISPRVNLSGTSEVYFAKLTGRPNTTGTIILNLPGNISPKLININEQGVLNN